MYLLVLQGLGSQSSSCCSCIELTDEVRLSRSAFERSEGVGENGCSLLLWSRLFLTSLRCRRSFLALCRNSSASLSPRPLSVFPSAAASAISLALELMRPPDWPWKGRLLLRNLPGSDSTRLKMWRQHTAAAGKNFKILPSSLHAHSSSTCTGREDRKGFVGTDWHLFSDRFLQKGIP